LGLGSNLNSWPRTTQHSNSLLCTKLLPLGRWVLPPPTWPLLLLSATSSLCLAVKPSQFLAENKTHSYIIVILGRELSHIILILGQEQHTQQQPTVYEAASTWPLLLPPLGRRYYSAPHHRDSLPKNTQQQLPLGRCLHSVPTTTQRHITSICISQIRAPCVAYSGLVLQRTRQRVARTTASAPRVARTTSM
jgi:hypothetical protein